MGFSIGYFPRNWASAYEQAALIDDYLAEELKFGCVAGPFDSPPIQDLTVNRFGIIPKSTPGKFRLITDLSFPHGNSVNDLIPDSEATVSYAGIPQAVNLLVELGPGAFLAKFDIQRAYRLLPIHPAHRRYCGMRWKGQFYVDLALPFGLRSAPRIFTRFADVLQHIFIEHGGVDYILHYLDDFLLAGPPESNSCDRNLSRCFSLAEELGVPIAPNKTEGPATSITFLGFILDSVKQELRLPPEKIAKARASLSSWEKAKHGSKRSLLSLIGLLQHCCQALVLARPFLRRLIDRATRATELHHFVWLSPWERDDIVWWHTLLDRWNGRSLFLFPNQELSPDFAITSEHHELIGLFLCAPLGLMF